MKALALAGFGTLIVLAVLSRDRVPSHTAVEAAGCRPGFAWRQAAPDDAVCVGFLSRDRVALENRVAASRRVPVAPGGAATCREGLVWREAFAGDTTCVPPRVRDLVRDENALAAAAPGSTTRQAAISPGRGSAPAAR